MIVKPVFSFVIRPLRGSSRKANKAGVLRLLLFANIVAGTTGGVQYSVGNNSSANNSFGPTTLIPGKL